MVHISNPVDLTKITIFQDKPPHRYAYIGKFKERFNYGVHDGVKEHYGYEPEVEYPSTLDHVVASAGGWLTGTLAGALEVRKIPSYPDKLKTIVVGTIEAPEGVLKITKIACHYDIKIPKGKRKAAERTLNTFEKGCPVAQTLNGCIEFSHSWDIEEY